MEIFLFLVFALLAPALAFYGGQSLDDAIWKSQRPYEKNQVLAGWAWLAMSLFPFTTGTLILVFVWLPILAQVNLVNKVVPFIFGAVHLIVGIAFVLMGFHYFNKKKP